ncbi:unnamed protein product [Orchesella dallaii]|uniref:Major facilitator superfamily (MFS) profile domain-containing protein n=1 Tax=Orchesella dallaii TaxID=48710 RepID=A0ABP1QGM9_9HEXA
MGYEGREEVQIFPNKEFSAKRQWIATIAASIGIWATGTVLGWSSPSNPELEESGDLGELSKNQLSWIASIAVVAALLSCFIIGYTVEKIGRKLTSIIMVIPFVIGYAVMASAQSVFMLYAGRFITGFSGGAYTVITSVYIAEIAQDRLRNTMGTVMVVCLCSGIAFVYIVGAVVSWRITSIICGVVPILHGVAMLFVPDTPRYLLSKGQTEKAAASLQWLRGAPSVQDIEPELKEIQSSIEEANSNASGGSLLVGSTIKPCLMSVTAMAFQQLAGINAVIFFSVDIFKAAGSDIDPSICAIIVGMTQAIGFAFAGILMNKFGRKPLFFFSEVGMCISLAALGVFYYLKEEKPETAENLGWLPLLSLVMYMVTYCCGVGPLPWTLMGDLCPPHIKGIASAMTTSTNWGLGFLVTFTFQGIVDAIQGYGAFWIFSGICALGAAFAAFVLPETKGKTVEEIMRLFADKV